MAQSIEIKVSKTKSGNTARVACIPAALVDSEGPERMHWRATELAQEHECSHYRILSASGQVVAQGKAGALPTQEQTARTHGDGSDWSGV